MSQEKIYVGNGNKVDGKYGTFRRISICITDLPKEFINKGKNGKEYISLNISDMQEANQWGKDIAVSVNTYKPDGAKAEQPKKVTPVVTGGDDLPF